MRAFGKITLWFLAALLLLGGLLWFNRDRLIADVARPWLAETIAGALDAETGLGSLEVGPDRIVLVDLDISRPDQFSLHLPRLLILFHPLQILRRHLLAVELDRPAVSLHRLQTTPGTGPSPIPQHPPLTIERVSVRQGTVAVNIGDRAIRIADLDLASALGDSFPLQVAGRIGTEQLAPFSIEADGRWDRQPAVTLTQLAWGERQLLREPLTLMSDSSAANLALGLETLNARMLAELLEAAGERDPTPAGIDWVLTRPRFNLAWQNDQLEFGLAAEGGRLNREGQQLAWQQLAAALVKEGAAWQFGVDLDLPGKSRFRGDGALVSDIAEGTWRLTSRTPLSLVASFLPQPYPGPHPTGLDLSGRWRLADKRLDLPAITLRSALGGGGWSGTLAGEARLRQLDAGWDLSVGMLKVESLEFLAADGLAGWTGGEAKLHGTGRLDGETLSFKISGALAVQEALYQDWFGDLRRLPVSFEAAGRLKPASGAIELDHATADVADIGTIRFQGRSGKGKGNLRGSLAIPDLAGPLTSQLHQIGSNLPAFVQELDLAGPLEVETAWTWDNGGWQLTGMAKPDGVSLQVADQIRLAGLRGKLPFMLADTVPENGNEQQAGRLDWQGLQAGPLQSGPTGIGLTASLNRWRQSSALQLRLGGGDLVLSGLAAGWGETGMELTVSAALHDLDLRQLSEEFGWPELHGRLQAELRDVHYGDDQLSLVGGAEARVFGGVVKLANMSVRSPFSPHPLYRLDADFSGIDLLQLTETFAFGEINGIADGHVHGLELYRNTPSQFQARFETSDSGTRNISVKALRNINTLSQGGLSSALSQGIYQFIDFYRYRRIGLECELKNDLFQIRGTARKDDPRYLIEGSLLPPRIDVLVSSPTISFKEMVKRLQRIERAER